MKKTRFLLFFTLSLAALLLSCPAGDLFAQSPPGVVTKLGNFNLSISMINQDIWVFDLAPEDVDQNRPVNFSMMVNKGQTIIRPRGSGDSYSSDSLSVRLVQNPPMININYNNGEKLFTISPYAPDGQLTGISFNGDYSHLAGLGADYSNTGSTLNLVGSNVLPANPFGNGRVQGFGNRPNQVQIPIVYAMGEGLHCGALFVDETRPLQWSLSGRPWTVSTAGPLGPERSFRFFVIAGEKMADLRTNFMSLTGRPPVPPYKAMGVWATGLRSSSEAEYRDRILYLKNNVPGLSGLVASEDKDAEALINVAKAMNLRLLADESLYLPQDSPHYTDMARRSYLVRQGSPGGPITVVTHQDQPGAILDYSNSSAAAFWHSLERINLVAEGISSFRLIDGDLPAASSEGWYQGQGDNDIHSHYAWNNIFSLKWQEGLINAVANQRLRFRPRLFLMSRTGLAGLTRLSGALYNGEGGLFIPRSILGARGHLALSGVDYYSSDITHNLPSRPVDQNTSLYDTWLAKSCLTDIPLLLPEDMLLRPSARYNLSLRETLGPYFYSLAWEAYLNGQPILAPLAYHFQDDSTARSRESEMMLGSGLLIGLDFDGAAERTNVYVPKGLWYNWRSGEMLDQKEAGLVPLDIKDAGQLTPPILARAGAIIPAVEEVSLKGGAAEKISALKIFIGKTSSDFTWYEDDGESQDYVSRKAFGQTHISAVTNLDGSTVVTIKAREGNWDGAPAERRLVVDIYGPSAPGEATLDGLPHNRVARSVELDQLDSGWASIGTNRIRFKTPPLETNVDHVLWFK